MDSVAWLLRVYCKDGRSEMSLSHAGFISVGYRQIPMDCYILNFLKNFHTVSITAVLIYTPTAVYNSAPSQSHQHL